MGLYDRSLLHGHPVTANRLSYLDRAAGDPVEVDLLALLEGIPVGPNPEQGVFEDNTFLHPALDLALVFPEDWQTFNAPMPVGALAPQRDAALYYSLDDSGKTPTALGEAFVADMPVEYRNLLDRSEPVTVNGIPAYVVTLVQTPRSRERIYLHMAWADFGEFTLRLAAYGG
jgi:predicted Zn-dependent protease